MPDLVVTGQMTAMALGFGAFTPAAAAGLGSGVGQAWKSSSGDAKLDKYGRGITDDKIGVSLGAKELLMDVNLLDSKAYLINTKHTKYGVWREIEAQVGTDGNLHVSQDNFFMRAFYTAGFNLVCDMRSSVGEISGIATEFGA